MGKGKEKGEVGGKEESTWFRFDVRLRLLQQREGGRKMKKKKRKRKKRGGVARLPVPDHFRFLCENGRERGGKEEVWKKGGDERLDFVRCSGVRKRKKKKKKKKKKRNKRQVKFVHALVPFFSCQDRGGKGEERKKLVHEGKGEGGEPAPGVLQRLALSLDFVAH